jgi:hypothetical protein
LRLCATSASPSLNPLPSLLVPYVNRKLLSEGSLRFKLSHPSAFLGSKSPSFHSPFEEASENRCPDLRKSHPRVWLPSRCVFQLSYPRKPLSASNAPGFLPSELFSSLVIGAESLLSFSALALSQQTLRPIIGASAAFSHLGSRSPYAPRRFSSGRGRSALLGLFTSRASPSDQPPMESSPFHGSLFVSWVQKILQPTEPGTLRSLSDRLGSPPS